MKSAASTVFSVNRVDVSSVLRLFLKYWLLLHALSCSSCINRTRIGVADAFSDITRKLLSGPTQLWQNAFDAYNLRFYSRSVQQKLKIIKYDDDADLVQLPATSAAVKQRQAFLQKMLYSAKLSARIYSRNIMKPFAATPATKSMKQQVLSFGEDDKPDCIVRFVPNENIDGSIDAGKITRSDAAAAGAVAEDGSVQGTLWVSVRGTATPYDAISNISWLTTTTPLGNYLLPTTIARRAQAIFNALVAFIETELNEPFSSAEQQQQKRLKVTNIIFTGELRRYTHSLLLLLLLLLLPQYCACS